MYANFQTKHTKLVEATIII